MSLLPGYGQLAVQQLLTCLDVLTRDDSGSATPELRAGFA